MNEQNQGQVDPVQEQARQDFAKWESHLHRATPWAIAGILNDIECEYVGVRHEDYCKTLHFLAFEYFRKQPYDPAAVRSLAEKAKILADIIDQPKPKWADVDEANIEVRTALRKLEQHDD